MFAKLIFLAILSQLNSVIGLHVHLKNVKHEKPISAFVSGIQSRNGKDGYVINVEISGKTSTHRLHPIPNHLAKGLNVYTLEHKNGKQKFNKLNHDSEDVTLYTDKTKDASLTVENHEGGYLAVEGLLNIDYVIKPAGVMARTGKFHHLIYKRKRQQFVPEEHCGFHKRKSAKRNKKIKRQKSEEDEYEYLDEDDEDDEDEDGDDDDEYYDEDDEDDEDYDYDEDEDEEPGCEDPESEEPAPEEITSITPEVLLVFDSKQSEYFEFDAKKAKQYAAVVYYQANRLYETVEDFKAKLYVTGILMLKNKAAEPDYDSILGPDGVGVIDEEAVALFGDWTKNSKLGEKYHYDVAMYSYSGDLGFYRRPGQKGWTNGVLGIVRDIGGACETKEVWANVGVSEDTVGLYSGIDTEAHEIAHLLGVLHNGSPGYLSGQPDSEKCADQDYIMRSNAYNKFKFGPCSSVQMKWFANRLRASCLWNKVDANSPDVMPTEQAFPGKWVSPNDQCRETMRDPKLVSVATPGSGFCRDLECADPGQNAQYVLPAMEGTPCGDGKHCIRGDCIPKDQTDVDVI